MTFKKRRKSLLGFISMALLVCILSTPATAAPSSTLSLDQISEKYGLKDIEASSIPENIQPIVFNDLSELDAFLAGIQNQTIELKQSPVEEISTDAETESVIQPMAIVTDYQTKKVADWSYGSMDMFVRYQYNNSSTPKTFITCNTIITTFTGVYTGCEWQQLDSWWTRLDSYRTLSASAYGHLTYYLLVNGSPKVYETNATVNGEFYL